MDTDSIFEEFEIKSDSMLIPQMKFSLVTNQRRILIDGIIDDNTVIMLSYYFSKIELMDKFANKEDIEIWINTNGGEATACFTIVDMIEQMKDKGYNVITINIGKAYSAGLAIALCGSTRKAFRRARYMMHDISSGTSGKSQDITEYLEEMKVLKKTFYEIVMKYSNITYDDLVDWQRLKLDKFFSVDEMLELKGVDVIL